LALRRARDGVCVAGTVAGRVGVCVEEFCISMSLAPGKAVPCRRPPTCRPDYHRWHLRLTQVIGTIAMCSAASAYPRTTLSTAATILAVPRRTRCPATRKFLPRGSRPCLFRCPLRLSDGRRMTICRLLCGGNLAAPVCECWREKSCRFVHFVEQIEIVLVEMNIALSWLRISTPESAQETDESRERQFCSVRFIL
jgi:hypothetical protein